MLAFAAPPLSSADPLLQWQLAPPLIAVAGSGLLYALGFRRRARRRRKVCPDAVCFAMALAALVLVLASPIATYDDELFWVHMLQHVLILTVVPPLVLLGRPWATIARAAPRRVLRTVALLARDGPPVLPWLASPLVALALFCVALAAWHLPPLYDATLRSAAIHELEHAIFLATGLLFWSQLIDSPPFRSRLDYRARAVYAGLAMLTGWVLAVVLALASAPLYSGYAALDSRPGGISALSDQQLAAGVMWVPGSLSLTAALVVFVYRWLGQSPAGRKRVTARAGAEM